MTLWIYIYIYKISILYIHIYLIWEIHFTYSLTHSFLFERAKNRDRDLSPTGFALHTAAGRAGPGESLKSGIQSELST